jgi:hypothetical protein
LVSAKSRPKFSSVSAWGISVGGVAKISPEGLSAVDSIHTSGKAPMASSTRPPA